MKAQFRGHLRQLALVHLERIEVGVVGADPDVVVAGDEDLAAGEVGELAKTLGEKRSGADVAGEDEYVGGAGAEELGQQPRFVPAAAVPPVQVGSHGQG